jgi:hypothetical protein
LILGMTASYGALDRESDVIDYPSFTSLDYATTGDAHCESC